jgi:hypothetical protein
MGYGGLRKKSFYHFPNINQFLPKSTLTHPGKKKIIIALSKSESGGFMSAENIPKRPPANSKSHMPENSVLFEKVIPVALVLMGLLTAILILFAAGVLLGIVQF